MNETHSPEEVKTGSFNGLHLLITAGLVAGVIVTWFFCDVSGLLSVILWIAAVFSPYVLLMMVFSKLNGMPGFLRNKAGGIIILVILAAFLLFAEKLQGVFFWIFCISFFLSIFGLGGNSVSTVKIKRKDSHGHTVTETRTYLGDDVTAEALAAKELRSEGCEQYEIEAE